MTPEELSELESLWEWKRQALEVFSPINDYCQNYDNARRLGIQLGDSINKRVLEILAAYPLSPAKQEQQGWIDVNESLPEVMNRKILVYDGREVFQGYLNQLDQWCSVRHDNKYQYNVTHWMPLPPPPSK
jgi:hypothetical protein